jgi:hypothetical protein
MLSLDGEMHMYLLLETGEEEKMMSAAMLLMAGTEQTSVRPVSADLLAEPGTANDISFAKSFNDRVGEPVLLREKSSAEVATIGLPGLRAAIPAKKVDGTATTLEEVKGNSVAGQEISGQRGLKSVAAYKIVESPTPAVAGSREKIAATDSGTKKVEPPVDEDEGVDVVPSSSPVPYAVPSSGVMDENLVAPVSIAEEQRPLVSRADSTAVEKETGSIGKTKEFATIRKTVKVLDNTATSRVGQKAVSTEVNATSKATAVIVREDATPIIQGAVAGVVVIPQNDAGKTTEGLNKVVPAVNASSDVFFPTAGRSLNKQAEHRTKAVAEDSETAVPSTEGQPMLPKSETTAEKIVTAIPAGGDGGSKGQGGPEAFPAMVHSIAGAVQVSGTSPTAVVAGNTSGELTTAKVPVGDAGVHTVGLAVGSREQDLPGVVTASMNEAPRTLTATPTALEVGIQNGTHGWLRVRAEMADSGVVNASVSAASSTGQEMLHRELPALTAYLQEEKVAVNAIVVHAPLAGGTEPRSFTGMDSAGGQTQRGNEGGEQQQNVRKQILDGSEGAITYQGLQGIDEDGSLSLGTYASGGSWLSVRA